MPQKLTHTPKLLLTPKPRYQNPHSNIKFSPSRGSNFCYKLLNKLKGHLEPLRCSLGLGTYLPSAEIIPVNKLIIQPLITLRNYANYRKIRMINYTHTYNNWTIHTLTIIYLIGAPLTIILLISILKPTI